MGLSCDCSFDGDFDWYWELPSSDTFFQPLNTKRCRRCASCGKRIAVGDECTELHRWRYPRDEPPYIEERIYGDEVPLAPWFLCETCSGLALALDELKFCFTLGHESLKQQIAEYNELAGVQTFTQRLDRGRADD